MASQQVIHSFLMAQGNNFPSEQIPYIQQQLANVPDEQVMALIGSDFQSVTLMVIISVCLGSLGLDRFLLGDMVLGVLKLITGGGCGIWWIVDIFLISDLTKQYNFQNLQQKLMY